MKCDKSKFNKDSGDVKYFDNFFKKYYLKLYLP